MQTSSGRMPYTGKAERTVGYTNSPITYANGQLLITEFETTAVDQSPRAQRSVHLQRTGIPLFGGLTHRHEPVVYLHSWFLCKIAQDCTRFFRLRLPSAAPHTYGSPACDRAAATVTTGRIRQSTKMFSSSLHVGIYPRSTFLGWILFRHTDRPQQTFS